MLLAQIERERDRVYNKLAFSSIFYLNIILRDFRLVLKGDMMKVDEWKNGTKKIMCLNWL